MKLVNLPNIISFLRLPLAILLITTPSSVMRYVYLILAIISDGADGYLAKKLHQKTKAGGIIDPLFDKIFVVIVFVYFYVQLNLPAWTLLIFTRDVVTFSMTLAHPFFKKNIDVKARTLGKIVTVLQFITLLFLVAENIAWVEISIVITFIMSLAAITDYVVFWRRS